MCNVDFEDKKKLHSPSAYLDSKCALVMVVWQQTSLFSYLSSQCGYALHLIYLANKSKSLFVQNITGCSFSEAHIYFTISPKNWHGDWSKFYTSLFLFIHITLKCRISEQSILYQTYPPNTKLIWPPSTVKNLFAKYIVYLGLF